MMKRYSSFLMFSIVIFVFLAAGCVERLITVTSEPPGAVLWLNDTEVGTTPVTGSFTWYGVYDVVLRKDGYDTIHRPEQINPPIYQWPVIDLFAECLLPFRFVDEHKLHFDLAAAVIAEPNDVIDRAESLRRRALQSQ